MVAIEVEKSFYVPIQGPSDLRRHILGNVKKVLILLKRYEKYKQIRKEKLRHFHKLRERVCEIETLNRKLSRALPKTHLRALPKQQKVQEKKPEEKKKPEDTTLNKIENELQDIESRLRSLD